MKDCVFLYAKRTLWRPMTLVLSTLIKTWMFIWKSDILFIHLKTWIISLSFFFKKERRENGWIQGEND
jgi:hypothetical protein